MSPQELHSRYDARLFSLTHLTMDDVVDGSRNAEYRMLLDEIGAFGFAPVEVFADDGSPSYFGYRRLGDEKNRRACVERHVVNRLHALRPNIQFAFRDDGADDAGATRSTLVAHGIPEEAMDAARAWLRGFLDGFGVQGHVFRCEVV